MRERTAPRWILARCGGESSERARASGLQRGCAFLSSSAARACAQAVHGGGPRRARARARAVGQLCARAPSPSGP
eukprot:9386308-Alexandrium_andersonii.AAC.1